MLPLKEALVAALDADQRPPDGLLHCSSILEPLRHTQLKMAGAPQKPDTFASRIRLMTGTLWHTYLGEAFIEAVGDIGVMLEIPVNKGLPAGWGGTADALFYDEPYADAVLVDIKTTKGEGIKWIHKDGAKPEHVWQISSYYWALKEMGHNLAPKCAVWYLPLNEVYDDEPVEPTLQEIVPLPKQQVWDHMIEVRERVNEYIESLTWMLGDGGWLTNKLADPQPRVQKLFKNKDVWDVKLVPHWTSMFCPFDDELCNCGAGGFTKIGHFTANEYVPRAGYELTEPSVFPVGRS